MLDRQGYLRAGALIQAQSSTSHSGLRQHYFSEKFLIEDEDDNENEDDNEDQ
jgi:hypothetical protein